MLSVREHVALRAVERSFADRAASAAAWDLLCTDVDHAIGPLFFKGRKLRDGDVDRIADKAARRIEELVPLVSLDNRRPATRAKPKGEMRELLCVAANAGEDNGHRFVEVCTIRVMLSRKRASIEAGTTCMRVTEHAMQRSIERGVVEEGDGVEHRFALQMLCHAGLVVMGRALLGSGDLEWSDAFPLPFEDGLILGKFVQGERTTFDRVVYDAVGRVPCRVPPSPLLTTDPRGAGGDAPLAVYRGATVINCWEMASNQGELWEALRRFSSRHREVVNAVGEAVLWPGSVLRPPASFASFSAAFDEAVADLRDIMHDPLLQARRGSRARLRHLAGADAPAEEAEAA